MAMTEREVRDFLAQFDQAREDFKTWPQWMQDAAVERAASFPMTPKTGVGVVHAPRSSMCEHECAEAAVGGNDCKYGPCTLLAFPPMDERVAGAAPGAPTGEPRNWSRLLNAADELQLAGWHGLAEEVRFAHTTLACGVTVDAPTTLTDERIGQLFADHDECKTYRDGINFARAVLRAAGVDLPDGVKR
jgi:hypothetical protein